MPGGGYSSSLFERMEHVRELKSGAIIRPLIGQDDILLINSYLKRKEDLKFESSVYKTILNQIRTFSCKKIDENYSLLEPGADISEYVK